MTEIPHIYLDLLLQKKAFAHLATVMPDGSPQNTPVWFDYTDGKIRVNSARGCTTVRNMKVGAKVALSIMDRSRQFRSLRPVARGRNPWEAGRGGRGAYRQPGAKVSWGGQKPLCQTWRCAGDVRDHRVHRPGDELIAAADPLADRKAACGADTVQRGYSLRKSVL
jgi:Pyridoxamine 5'-phosphate oxidase